jgi:hypothetical protein
VNGGAGDGSGNGGQVDCFGATWPGAFAGAVLITPANVGTGHVRIRDRAGNDRIHIDTSGNCNVSKGRFSDTIFNAHPNSNNQVECGEEPGTTSGTYLAMRVNGRTVYVPFYTSVPT